MSIRAFFKMHNCTQDEKLALCLHLGNLRLARLMQLAGVARSTATPAPQDTKGAA